MRTEPSRVYRHGKNGGREKPKPERVRRESFTIKNQYVGEERKMSATETTTMKTDHRGAVPGDRGPKEKRDLPIR